LAIIKTYIDKINHSDIKKFFLTAFSETIRESSLTKKGEFKLVRIPEEKRLKFNPDCFGIMLYKLSRNKKGLVEFSEIKRNGAVSEIHGFNTVKSIPKEVMEDESVDVVVTSPPYGDSRTTVAYGQYSRLSNQWMGIENAPQIDNELMGGKTNKTSKVNGSTVLNLAIEKIGDKDEKRATEVLTFFDDYQKSINNLAKKMKRNKYACYVVGNRTVKDEKIPMDEITKNFFEANNFKHIETIVRNIPNKRMPSENSPTNQVGKKSSTMKQEYIVVMQKQ